MLVGIDPGREKFGWAFVKKDGNLLLSGVTPLAEFNEWLVAIGSGEASRFGNWVFEGKYDELFLPPVEKILLGEGTGMKKVADILRSKNLSFDAVPEAYSTLRARKLYWVLHPPRGLGRLVPLSFRVPPRPIDDLAAWRLALDFLGLSGED